MILPIRVIASANGLQATRLAYELIQQGHDPLHAVVEGVTLVEDDPNDLTVGYGGLPNEAGEVELDAAVMHGPSHRAGAVAAVKGVRHVARLARLVLEQTKHVLLVGPGAQEFARIQGFPQEDLLTEKARKIWRYWKQTNSSRQDWIPPAWGTLDPAVREFFHLYEEYGASSIASYQRSEAVERPTGTVHCAGMNSAGEISCVTSTSGLAFKLPGRVGDSPIIGSGLYVDGEIGSCGSTGRGEENLRNCSSFAAVELMRQGRSPGEAGREVLERIVRNARESWLLGKDGRPNFGLKLYLLDRSGNYAGVSIWGPTEFAVTDGEGTRLEVCEYLFQKEE
jgi:N4-(beta-N-acetylglucosaminyl)-L-asparaginase